jgi:hypothetical protein
MTVYRPLFWLSLASALVFAGGGSSHGETNPTSRTARGVAATVGRYMDGLRRTDVAAVRAVLAPDYQYDRSAVPAFDPANPFTSPLGLTYRSLFYRIEALTTAGKTATANVTTVFDADVKLPLLGRTPVIGSARLLLELEPRGASGTGPAPEGGEWELTAVRPVRVRYRNPQVPLPAELLLIRAIPTLFDETVNGQISLKAPPNAPLTMAGKSRFAAFVVGLIGTYSLANLKIASLKATNDEPWELRLGAPATPGRFLTYALSIVLLPDPATGALRFLTGDQVTIPVTVVPAP